MAEAKNYSKWIVDRFSPYIGQDLIEVGIGAETYFHHFGSLNSYTGVDIDAEAIKAAARIHPERSYKCADLGDAAFPDIIGSGLFDTVFCANVLEHIDNDSLAVNNLLQVLRPGGHLLLFVPAFNFLYTDLDRLAGHIRRYNRQQLLQTLPEQGVSVLRIEYFNPVGGLGWWAQKLVKHDSLEGKGVKSQIHLFDKYVLPVSRLCNGLTKYLFGQSVICVARKEI